MNTPKNIRIVVLPVSGTLGREYLESIENQNFKNVAAIVFDAHAKSAEHENHNWRGVRPYTVEEFSKQLAFSSAHKSFQLAISNHRKRKQCYKLTDFMDDFNNQEFGRETDNYWIGYVKVKKQ